ncbi:MAG: hypothetical protein O7157_00785 [Wolbachia endosymbiont of Tetragnatha montana]|nr:hypothetical protein [Wolbachia endosymbiont of Tetragnatha montana]
MSEYWDRCLGEYEKLEGNSGQQNLQPETLVRVFVATDQRMVLRAIMYSQVIKIKTVILHTVRKRVSGLL